MKNPVLPPTDVVGPHGASSKEKAILAIHPRSSEGASWLFHVIPFGKLAFHMGNSVRAKREVVH